MRVRLIALLAAAFLGVGSYGAWAYVHNYVVYRGFPPPRDAAGVKRGKLVRVSFFSRPLHRRDSYLVYLPAGYATAAARGVRFPVLYLLHGTGSVAMLFIDVGRVGVDVDELLARHRIKPFLVVMPEAVDGTFVHDTEWANTAHGAYESAVLAAVRNVDSRWATIPSRGARAIAGLSMGGYGAVNIALRNLPLFSTIESWSGYFTQTRDGVYAGASPAALRAASPQNYAGGLSGSLRRFPIHVLLYTGRDRFAPQQGRFAAELRSLGVPALALNVPGAHSWALWRHEMPLALRYASRRLAGG
ncbi:MAG TPA: alpha/beta hydrolase-fold protein [Solirubrobacterales bacterium]|nr:alpha/beta hydrolase-fold protein [Solirubrobacterales bacterium]